MDRTLLSLGIKVFPFQFQFRVEELCGGGGGRPWLPVPNTVIVSSSVDVKQH